MRSVIPEIDKIAESARMALEVKNQAREAALARCREAIRHSANAIRAVHRQEYPAAKDLIERAATLLSEAKTALADQLDIFYAGFVHDAQKEYAEASLTLALVSGQRLPSPSDLDVELPAYLNGLGEAVGELRRHLLDSLRSGAIEYCEDVLSAMDEIYGSLVTFDYPEAMTGGLRRTTDNVRGILERSRGDLTLAVRQRELERKLSDFEGRLKG